MDPALETIVLERLAASEAEEALVDVVLGACESEAALDAALRGERAAPRGVAEAANDLREPSGAYLARLEIEGFRGIGPPVVLPLDAGPGLTLVVGRNGSGKSSFAEGLEILFTGENRRWTSRSQIWREGWRNLHRPGEVRVEAALLVDGEAGERRVARTWAADAGLADGEAAGLDDAGWAEAVERYRPFLSYNELGAMFEGRPTEFYDALSGILGLADLAAAEARLRAARRERETRAKAVRGAVPELVRRLAGVEDERARRAHLALAARLPDLDAVEEALQGEIGGLDPAGEIALLRELAQLAPPPADQVARLVEALRDAQAQLDAVTGTDADEALALADLLDDALALHAAHGDRADCPVCRQPPGLDTTWRIRAEVEAGEHRTRGEDASAVRRQADQLRHSARGVVDARPPAGLERAAEADVDATAALEAWRAWNTPADTSLRGLADHLAAVAAPLAEAVDAVRASAEAALARREDAWRPAALLVAEWLAGARRAAAEAGQLRTIKDGEAWLRDTAADVRAERFAPIAEQARAAWELLRQGSNVQLEDVGLAGSHTAANRRVDVGVTIDGVEAAALGVMSQGELHSLALSLFLPRASLPESPFRFMVIDDPVQSMDPAKVDGLARVLHEAARGRQVVVFTHDDRLPEAVRRLDMPASLLEVTRRPGSVVEVRTARDPVEQALDDARALVRSEGVPAAVAARVVPGFCRIAIEAGCAHAVRRRRLLRGEPHADVEQALSDARTLSTKVALALYDDPRRGGDVLSGVANRFGRAAADALARVNRGAHEADAGALPDLVRDAAILARALAELR